MVAQEAWQQEQRQIRWSEKHGPRLKRAIVLFILLIPIGTANAKAQNIHCPGNNTVEMQYCAGAGLGQSNTKLKAKISAGQFRQWQEMTGSMCIKAYAPYKEGTIYSQLVTGCEDHLNRALLKEFQPLGN